MRTGVLLPIFGDNARRAIDVATRAEAVGIDGVFCYDHLWPMGQPGRPALAPFPMLGHIAATTTRIAVGTLVARVGLVPDTVLLSELGALATIAPGRVIAGMGTGDRLSAGENEAYGVAFDLAAERRKRLRGAVRAALERGLVVWVGDGAPATRRIATEEGAAQNAWGRSPEVVAAYARRAEVTWAGPASGPLAPMLARLFDAGATWAVLPWPVDLEELVTAARALREPV